MLTESTSSAQRSERAKKRNAMPMVRTPATVRIAHTESKRGRFASPPAGGAGGDPCSGTSSGGRRRHTRRRDRLAVELRSAPEPTPIT